MPGVVRDEPSEPGLDPKLLPLTSSECVVGSDPSVISDTPSDVPMSVTLLLAFSDGVNELRWVTEKMEL